MLVGNRRRYRALPALLIAGLIALSGLNAAAQTTQAELSAKVEAATGPTRVDALNALSKSYWGVSAQQALQHARLALEQAQAMDYPAGEAAAWRNIGIAYWYDANYQSALENSLRARQIYQRLDDASGEAATMSTIATILMNTQRIDEAIALYREAIPIAERAQDRNRLGIIYSNLGTAHLGLEQPQEALVYLQLALPVLREVGSQWDVLTCLANIGGAHRRMGNYLQALAVNQELLQVALEVGNHERIAEALADIGQAHAGLGNQRDALNYLERALSYAVEHELKRTQMTTLESLAELHEAMGNPALALAAYKRHSALSAEALNVESAKAMADLQVRYETEQKERELQIQRLQIERQRAQQFGLGVLLLAALVGTIVVLRLYQQKRRAVIELDKLSRTDPLTGVANRRAVRTLAGKLDQSTGDRSYGVILFDIDHFKRINDRYGHDSGDTVLKGVSAALSTSVRSNDLVGRWGGEEFVVIAPDIDTDALGRLAERCHTAIAAQEFALKGQALRVTATAGWTLHGSQDDFDQTLNRADLALYAGKESGRNRLVAA